MALKKKLNFLWTLVLYLIATRLPKAFANDLPRVPSILDPKFINAFLNIHNELRRKVQPPAADMNQLIWDEKLARLAKAWTRECKLAHNPCTSKKYGCLLDYDFIGENIYLGEVETQPEDVVNNWHNENTYYNFVDNTCSKICVNYTQVVWAKTFKIGCAVSNCPNLNRYSAGLFVCNYSPTGNFIDFRPYRTGDPCSMCGQRKCENSLCRPMNRKTPHQKAACHVLVLGFILQRLL
ncbi:GLIPR1-like protein 1 [Mus caroli]|uniref:GLIPR1-like protein 1 n=1 Tax=Mus caroli TaxID=10089 RepID=A0A6P5QPL7_MUSCR|nr:GLIPR1-like protein 1 [Mus caroli]